jgi:hypothetical protein
MGGNEGDESSEGEFHLHICGWWGCLALKKAEKIKKI